MRPFAALLLGTVLMAGCANPYPQPRYIVLRPVQPGYAPPIYAPPAYAPATPARPQPDPAPMPGAATELPSSIAQPLPEAPQNPAPVAATPAKTPAADPGSNVPMMGFRPMRGQKTPGA